MTHSSRLGWRTYGLRANSPKMGSPDPCPPVRLAHTVRPSAYAAKFHFSACLRSPSPWFPHVFGQAPWRLPADRKQPTASWAAIQERTGRSASSSLRF